MASLPPFITPDLLCGLLLGILITFAALALPGLSGADVYSLAHWKLHVQTPLQPLWMNIGYWHDASMTRLQDACAALLREVLATASLSSSGPLSVLDVGFGCGDQTWELARLVGRDRLQYAGITNNAAQMRVARARMARELVDGQQGASSFSLFLGDASDPGKWDEGVTKALSSKRGERWLMGLDCLYHFKPSRMPLLRYAAKELGANFMAFDLLLNDKASAVTKMLAKIVCRLMGCPVNAFLMPAEYAAQLIECGYDGESIILRDVSEDVFPGFIAFMKNQETSLQEYGIKMGALKYAGKLFSWFHSSGAVRATIVVARVAEAKRSK